MTTASLWLPQPDIRENGRYNDNAAQVAFYRKALERIRALPGVTEAAGATRVPFNSGRFKSRLEIEGRDAERDGTAVAEGSSASTRYFATLGIPLKTGRDFDERDVEGGEPVLIVSESFARRFFPGEDPLGKRLRFPVNPGNPRTELPTAAALDVDRRRRRRREGRIPRPRG